MQTDGVYEIREFIDDSGVTTSNEVHNVKKEFQDLQAQFEKIRKSTGSDAPVDEDAAKQADVTALLNSISSDMSLSEDDKNSVENIGEDMSFVRELAKLHEQSGRTAETDYLTDLEALAASEVAAMDQMETNKVSCSSATGTATAAPNKAKKGSGGGGWKKGFFGSSKAALPTAGTAAPATSSKKTDDTTATATPPNPPTATAHKADPVKKSVMFHDDIENTLYPEPSPPAVAAPMPEPVVSFHSETEKNVALDPAAGFKVTEPEEPKKRPAAFSGKIIERF